MKDVTLYSREKINKINMMTKFISRISTRNNDMKKKIEEECAIIYKNVGFQPTSCESTFFSVSFSGLGA